MNWPNRSRVVRKRDWHDLRDYVIVHENHMESLDYCVEQDNTEFEVRPNQLILHGDIVCHGGCILNVHKVLQVNERGQVLGSLYQYHARLPDPWNRDIFRYDNAHEYSRERHPDAFHKHTFNPWTGVPNPVEWIGWDSWPFMNEVIVELYGWWLRHRDHLEHE